MRLPRDVGGEELAALLSRYGYEVTRQTGSHMRLTMTQEGEHHITIPRHDSLRVGTLSAILSDVAEHLSIPRQTLLETLFGKRVAFDSPAAKNSLRGKPVIYTRQEPGTSYRG